jgi:aminopeptidase-like protein/aminoglycoside N3'-acetyltransferase
MPRPRFDYCKSDLLAAFQNIGIGAGDVVFVHVNIEALGMIEGGSTTDEICRSHLNALMDSVGPTGTILVPTYTFSFWQGEEFDAQNTPTKGGEWSPSRDFLEYFRCLPGVVRSVDPIYSVAGLGPKANPMLLGLPPTCFGEDSVFDRLKKVGGKICAIGLGLRQATFLHYVEESVGVPFRFKKLFTGYSVNDGRKEKKGWLCSVRILAPNGESDGSLLESGALNAGICKSVQVGRGEVQEIDSRTYFEYAIPALTKAPWTTAKGPAGDPVELEEARVRGARYEVDLPKDSSMEDLIQGIWKLPRDIVSDGYDTALRAFAGQIPMTILEYPTGTECWSWIVPEKWTCHEAFLEAADGRRLFSYADHPLHVVSYSLPFDGWVSREELFRHLHVHPLLSDAIPFVFKYYERDWGLCCSRLVRDSLQNERYRVVIRTDFSYGTLKVGEVIVPGTSQECIVLCAHLCHPAMVNDDLTGVVVGLKVMQELYWRKNLRYTYRFIILPETIGSVAYLSQHSDLVSKMKGGLFLEMLGLDNPHALQLSFAGITEIDECFTRVLNASDPQAWTGAFRTIVGNDERQFNAPGVRVPMLSLSRVMRTQPEGWHFFPEYHSSRDTPGLASITRLDESRVLVLQMIDALEGNRVPINRYPGEIFCSRFGINIDAYDNPEGNKALFDIMYLIDGTRSVPEIARICSISVQAASKTIDELHRLGLVQYHAGSNGKPSRL